MLEKRLDELEAQIEGLEDILDGEEDCTDEEIERHYVALIKMHDEIKSFEIEAFPFGHYSEKVEAAFHKNNKRFEKLQKRIGEIQKEDRFEGWKDASWMFDEDEEEFDF